MDLFEYCEKLPFTISIQFDFDNDNLTNLVNIFKNTNIQNKISNHISIKYLGYEENLSDEILMKILNKFSDKNFNIEKRELKILGFGIMDSPNPFFKKLLYLKVEPNEYLYQLHKGIISLLTEITDLYKSHDLENFIPHISCGSVENEKVLVKLNEQFSNTIFIKDWFLALHTSSKDYKIL